MDINQYRPKARSFAKMGDEAEAERDYPTAAQFRAEARDLLARAVIEIEDELRAVHYLRQQIEVAQAAADRAIA